MNIMVRRGGWSKPRFLSEKWFDEVRQNQMLARGHGDRVRYRRTSIALYVGTVVSLSRDLGADMICSVIERARARLSRVVTAIVFRCLLDEA